MIKTRLKDGRTYAKFADLTPWDKNPRDIKPAKLNQLIRDIEKARAITPDGQIKPVMVTRSGIVVGGNMRMRAFAKLAVTDVWVSILDTDDPKLAFEWAMRDNMAYGYYEEDKLADLAQELDIDIETLGELTIPEDQSVKTIAEIIGDIPEDPEVFEDEVPEIEETYQSKRGAVYQLGQHRIMCGDSTSEADVEKLMAGEKAVMVFTDPPYNVNYAGRGKNTSNTIKNDHMDDAKFQEFLEAVFATMKFASKPTAPAYVCYAIWNHREFENALNENDYGVRCQIIWVKPVANMSWANYRWKHEPILYAVPDGKSVQFYGDRKQYTHWEFKPSDAELLNWAKSLLTDEEEDDVSVWKIGRENVMGYEHPTSKPVKLPAKAILNSSRAGETVLDLFAGGGSTLIACEQTGRICRTMELDERYVDVVRKRYARFIGREDDWEAATPEVK